MWGSGGPVAFNPDFFMDKVLLHLPEGWPGCGACRDQLPTGLPWLPGAPGGGWRQPGAPGPGAGLGIPGHSPEHGAQMGAGEYSGIWWGSWTGGIQHSLLNQLL